MCYPGRCVGIDVLSGYPNNLMDMTKKKMICVTNCIQIAIRCTKNTKPSYQNNFTISSLANKHTRGIFNTTAIDIPGHIIIPQTHCDNYITMSMWEYQGKPWTYSSDHDTRYPSFKHWITLIPAWISNHIPSKRWDELMFPITNYNACKVEFGAWICNFNHKLNNEGNQCQ